MSAEPGEARGGRKTSLELAAWRHRMMPFAIMIIVAGFLLFSWVSYQQFADVRHSIEQTYAGTEIAPVLASYGVPAGDNGAIVQKVQLLMAERAQRAALTRAGASLLLSLWTRNMGFLTGMILALVGATFILSRLSDMGSELAAEQGGLKGSLKTSSPGIVLAVLGAALMAMAMSVRYTESGRDMTQAASASQLSTGATGAPLPDEDSTAETRSDLSLQPADPGKAPPGRAK